MQHGRYRTDLHFKVDEQRNRIHLFNAETMMFVASGIKEIETYLRNHDMVLVDK